jgi:eukaryotic-like serine/threonine-protein kinase
MVPVTAAAPELVMERFRLLERIGSGGMGVVYRGFDERLQRQVAVKEVAAAPDRVMREAQAAARLNHPAIVTLYELGEHDGRAVLVSELVPGRTLDRLRADGALSDREAGEIGVDLCQALVHAHACGVVHRDLKPENVIIRGDPAPGPRAKLMDFGIARLSGAPTLTEAGEVVGTLAYMSPEQASGEAVGPESDVYSLALTLYECWAGSNPVSGASPAETARRIGAPIRPLGDRRPDLPASLCEAVDACLLADPLLRPTALELGDTLERALPLLDAARAVPLPGGERASLGAPLALGRVAVLAVLAALLVLLAGPLGAGGLALVVAVCGLPAVAVAPSPAALCAPAGGVFAAIGIPGAAPVAAALALGTVPRAVLGALAWAWMLVVTIVLDLAPRSSVAPPAPDGWASDASTAAESVLAPLLEPRALAAAALFAAAAVTLGWVLARAHLALALLGTVLWAACLDAALLALAEPLGGRPLGLLLVAGAAVAIEFGVLRQPASETGAERQRLEPRFNP